ncbi:MBL fold metallo-hydrolase [Bacillus sp. DX1.1]|uniref:MBL fold metallo-hydrolase n=1 Tax=unclassified Bacillus (in: firmicutes) TaxID=185979 RepID=UPI002570E8F0|nr:MULTISPECIES: MBL fold metallo-hydrolase [unclassified Bacillus (in: firmicutes)]MDM5156457.1 MBL fold metallo-hydrolase [Bacillus sp. DX1.1]WJE80724.1 MBL fold metallo-hydrolase [Bacillus sp. DX3.1]
MKIEFLGTGGAIPIPRPGSYSKVSKEAREKGVPYSRMGPSVFVHDLRLLIDTPEEIRLQLERSHIEKVEAGIYSHWHPDHTMGRRIWETMAFEINRTWGTTVYIPEQVAVDMKQFLGSWDHLQFMQQQGWIDLNVLQDGQSFVKNKIKVTPFRLYEEYVYAFLLEEDDKKVLIAPDELYRWEPPTHLIGNLDLAVLPMGMVEFNWKTKERLQDRAFIESIREATFEDTLAVAKQLQAKQTIITHIEEVDNLGHDELQEIAEDLQKEGLNIVFAYDTMQIEI